MAEIEIKPSGERFELSDGASLRRLASPLSTGMGCHSGVCGSCAFRVLEGAENLNQAHETEMRTLERINAPEGARLLCRAKIEEGTVVVGKYDRNDVLAGLTVPAYDREAGSGSAAGV